LMAVREISTQLRQGVLRVRAAAAAAQVLVMPLLAMVAYMAAAAAGEPAEPQQAVAHKALLSSPIRQQPP
jgi:hypothetical protein